MTVDTVKEAPTTTAPPEASPLARQLAAGILEVLAGLRGPAEAAQALGISLARYYQVERRALDGLVAGCEPRRRCAGQRGPSELALLRQEVVRLRRECARQQALLRASQRTRGPVAAAPPPAPPAPSGGTARKRRPRRPRARALRMATLLREEPPAEAPTAAPTPTVTAEEPRTHAASSATDGEV